MHNTFISEKPFFIARTKVDKSVADDQRKFPRTFSEQRVINEIRTRCAEACSSVGAPWAKTFVVSANEEKKYDWQLMIQSE